jgi:uncharacterized protein (TIGR03086 family)
MDEVLDQHGRALDEFSRRVHEIGSDQWAAPTPCSDWDVRALVNHLAVEQLWVPPLLGGSTVAEVGDRFDGDQLSADPVAGWDAAASASRAAFADLGTLEHPVHLSYGDRPARDYCREMTFDLVVHSWDLARAIGADETLPDDLVAAIRERLGGTTSLAASGLFAEPVPAAPDADALTQLLALTGRRC